MNDKPVIIAGLLVFLAALALPVFYTLASGGEEVRSRLAMPEGEPRCVEEKSYMTGNHMQLLNEWRKAVVRDGKETYVSKSYGERHQMSLSQTCLKCHPKRNDFCNQCHNYADVHPRCWTCHVDPTGNNDE